MTPQERRHLRHNHASSLSGNGHQEELDTKTDWLTDRSPTLVLALRCTTAVRNRIPVAQPIARYFINLPYRSQLKRISLT